MVRRDFRPKSVGLLCITGVLASLATGGAMQLVAPPAGGANLPLSPASINSDAVLVGKEALILGPPELVVGPAVQHYALSPEGDYVIATREETRMTPAALRATLAGGPPPLPAASLALWNSADHREVEVWKMQWSGGTFEKIAWLPGSNVALALAHQRIPDPDHPGMNLLQRFALLRIDARTARSTVLASTEGQSDSLSFDVSPRRPIAILHRTVWIPPPGNGPEAVSGAYSSSFAVVRATGAIGPVIALPEAAGGPPTHAGGVVWDLEGNPELTMEQSGENGRFHVLRYRVDVQTGAIAPLSEIARGHQAPTVVATAPGATFPSPSLLAASLQVIRTAVQDRETTRTVSALWLEGTASGRVSRVLVSSDSSEGQFLFNLDGVLYRSQGALFVRPLLHVPVARYLEERQRAERVTAISNARQIGSAMMMYAQDYDETFPTPENINNKLLPYLKNSDLLGQFSYAYPGGSLKDIPNPAETQIGTVSGPGGVAELYADGHVRWIGGS